MAASIQHDSQEAANQAGTSDLLAVASNTPGLVYQFLLRDDGTQAFPYLSRGCASLLGVSANRLRNDPGLLLQLIEPEDRASYLETMQASASRLASWNWEGRIWIETWHDIKWINLRATPRRVDGVGIQWDGLMTNITQGKKAAQDILRSRRQLEELSAHVERVKEEERTRIAREIHDDLGGNLTAIKMALSQLTRRLPQGDTLLREKADYVDALVDRTIEAAHRISRDLRPSTLDLGIVAAIAWQAQEFEKQLGIPCEMRGPGASAEEIELPADQATGLFRIFQETLTNIGKHAQASRVEVRLDVLDDAIALEVRDNGRGLSPADRMKPKSFGIRGMVERVHALGGMLDVGPNDAGPGCRVAVRLPLPPAAREQHREAAAS